jgi:hypothetical protein
VLHSVDPPEEFVPLTREDPSAFSPPPAFGPFRVLHQIGIGALGPVFRTYEPARDRLVAVKVFRLDIVPEQAQALADALGRATQASLFHPSIVEPIAAGVEGTLAYRADEYVAAESLDVAMRHYAPATLEKALPFITQLAGAIDFARAAGVGHGALHPRDIFVTPDEARATGFGVVEALERVGIRAPVRRPYAAPERIDGAAWSTPADIFSLAAIAFELLTGRRPSGTGTQVGALPEGPHSAALHAVLARAMGDDPAKRFPTALAFVSALEAAGRAQPDLPPDHLRQAPGESAEAAGGKAEGVSHRLSTPGEFEIEKELDPVQRAIDDRAALVAPLATSGASDRGLFDADHGDDDDLDVRVRDDEPDAPLVDLPDTPIASRRFADEFVEEQAAEAETRRPLEAVHETIPPAFAAASTMFGASEQPPEVREEDDRPRMRMLPVALGFVLGLLIGFGIGHFVGRQTRDADLVAGTTTASPGNAPAATGAATPQQPGQYSEQKVSPSRGANAPSPSATPPPIPDETPAAAARPPATSRSTPAPATRGRLVVTSTPSRAGVMVNNTWRGRTPLTLDNLPFGRYVVRLVLPGYVTSRHEFTLSAREATQDVRARLDRTAAPVRPSPAPATRTPAKPTSADAFTGSLYVDSRPRGATVFLDGKNVGQTPLSIPQVAIGAHVVRLEMTGKRTWTSSTRVVAGETARVTGSLEDAINKQ